MDDVNGERPRFMNEAMGYEFLRFLEVYIKAEKVNTDAIHGNFPQFGSIFYMFEENGCKKKKRKCLRSTLNFHSFTV